MSKLLHVMVGVVLDLQNPRPRSERGLSQSTENAILLAGAAAIALVVITAVGLYVASRLPK